MSKYGSAIYGASRYGETPRLAYSVLPMSVLVLSFTDTFISWQPASGNFSKARLVRNQNSYPEHCEDGAIIWEENSTSLSRVYFTDSPNTTEAVGIVPGKPIFYKMFLFTDSKVWVEAGSATGIVPSDHDLQKKLVDTLPRVFTSKEQSPLAEPDTTSALYNFLDGVSFTLEEALTHIDVLNPDHTLIATPSSLLPIEAYNVGLTQEQGLPVKNQKKLIREAIYMYTHKGTANGLGTYVESLSGYAPTLTVSENKLLNVQDSTFYETTGNWSATNATISSTTEQVPDNVDNSIDLTYTCKIVASGAGSMTLGYTDPIRKGVPLTPGTTYTLSANIKSPSSAGTITPKLSLYDKSGTIIGTELSGSATSANNTWKSIDMTERAPHKETVAIQSATGDGSTITYTTYADHTLVSGTTVTVTGFTTTGFNKTNATVTDVTSNTFSVSGTQSGTSDDEESGTATNNETDATYAGIKFSWSAAGTYYIDMVCLQPGETVSYDEARAVNVYVAPNKVNYIKNPSFEDNVTDGWTLAGSATASQDTDVSDQAYSGTKSAKILATGSWTYSSNIIPITKGIYYTFSSLMKASSALTITFVGLDETDTPTGHSDVFNVNSMASWTRISATDLVDAIGEEDVVSYQVVIAGNSGTFYIDCAQFEQGPFSTDYFDGSLPESYGSTWQGDANNSYTSLYFSSLIKVPRLGYTLSEWVPSNCFWRLRSDRGLEYTSIQV